jgi:hypothetical protein
MTCPKGIPRKVIGSLLPLAGLLSGMAGMTLPQAVQAQGWVWDQKFPANLVTLNSGKRNNVFYAGQPVTFTLTGKSAVLYEVRDYWGNLVDQGMATTTIAPQVTQPGWYKLYLHGNPIPSTLGDSVGGTTFVIFRNNPNFPALPSPQSLGSTYALAHDAIMRGVTGIGPARNYVADASNPDQAIAALEGDIALDELYYLPYDGTRNRQLLIAFPNGTQNLDGVKRIVTHFKDRVMYWEPRNEPNGNSNGTDFVNKELIPFYETIKSVSPKLKVLGPGVVSVGPGMLGWIEDFLKAGGANYIDGFSFHAYNNIDGDFWLARASLDNLNALLAKYGADKIEKWQTEQGYFAAYYGAYAPRHQGRWTMAQMMAFEQYGIPKEHNVLWYDLSHGFWDFPSWTENDDSSLNPAGALMRVWSEELYSTNFAKAYNMGATGDKQYMGSLFQGQTKQVAVFMSAGATDGRITLNVTGGSGIHVVTAFGVEHALPVRKGQVSLPVSELPVYVEIAAGQTINVAPTDWGPNLALQPGVKVIASGSSAHPVWPSTDNSTTKLVNDQMENWYYAQQDDGHPWMSNVSSFPATIEVDLPSQQAVNRVAIYCPVPWQFDGSLLDYDLQYDNNGQWVTIGSAKEPTNTLTSFTPTLRCTVDSFYSDRNIFTHIFAPVTTSRLRLYVRDATWGGGAVKGFNDAQGSTMPHQINIREIEVYSPTAVNSHYIISGQMKTSVGKPMTGIPVVLSGWQVGQTKTDANGNYAFNSLEAGRTYIVTPQINDPALVPATQTVAHLYGNQHLNFTEVAAAAVFVKVDTTTQGNWLGVYGSEGYNIIGNSVMYPPNMQVLCDAPARDTWAISTNNVAALEKVGVADRIAAYWGSGWNNGAQFNLAVTPSDTQWHQLSLYCLDYDYMQRAETIEIFDAQSGALLDSRSVDTFSKGKYLIWNIRGHVNLRFTRGQFNAVISGIFCDPIVPGN